MRTLVHTQLRLRIKHHVNYFYMTNYDSLKQFKNQPFYFDEQIIDRQQHLLSPPLQHSFCKNYQNSDVCSSQSSCQKRCCNSLLNQTFCKQNVFLSATNLIPFWTVNGSSSNQCNRFMLQTEN